MIERLLNGLAVFFFLIVLTVPAILLALADTPAGRINLVFW